MKKLFFLTVGFIFLSCNRNGNNSDNIQNQQDNIVQNVESSSSSFRFKRGSNLLDAIYYESIKNDEKLKQIDEKINLIEKQSRELISQKDEIINKSNEYYSDADLEAKSINDSILRRQILSLLQNSSEKYNLKLKSIKNAIAQIKANNNKMENFYSAFKIKRTLPEIEKFQKQNPISEDDLNKLIKQQELLIENVKQLK